MTRSAVRVRVVDAGAARRLVYWGTTCEDVLPAASAGALSGVGRIVGRIVDIAGRNNQASAADGGFMDVEGTLPGWQESEASLITDTGLGRQQLYFTAVQESNNLASAADGGYMDVEGTRPGWQESDVSTLLSSPTLGSAGNSCISRLCKRAKCCLLPPSASPRAGLRLRPSSKTRTRIWGSRSVGCRTSSGQVSEFVMTTHYMNLLYIAFGSTMMLAML